MGMLLHLKSIFCGFSAYQKAEGADGWMGWELRMIFDQEVFRKTYKDCVKAFSTTTVHHKIRGEESMAQIYTKAKENISPDPECNLKMPLIKTV